MVAYPPPTRLRRATSPCGGGMGFSYGRTWLQKKTAAHPSCRLKCYLPGLKESFRLTERLKTRWPGAQSRLSGQM